MNTTPLVDYDATTDVVPAIKMEQRQISQSLCAAPDLHRLMSWLKTTYNIAAKTQLRSLKPHVVDPIRYVAYGLFMAVNAFYITRRYPMPDLVILALQELHVLSQGGYVVRRDNVTGKDVQCKLAGLTDAAALFAQHEAARCPDVAAALEMAQHVLINTAFM